MSNTAANSGYTDNGDGTHTYKQYLNEVIQCQDCGVIFAGEPYIATGTEAHGLSRQLLL